MARKQNFPVIPFRQVLTTETVHPDAIGARFYAVIFDPETQKRIAEVHILDLRPGETVELGVMRETLFAPKAQP